MRKYRTRALIAFGIAVLAASVVFMAYAVRAKSAVNGYIVRSTAAFNAAMMLNADETFTDADRAVVASYGDRSAVVAPENYKAVLYFLKSNAVMPFFGRVDAENALTLRICGETAFTVAFAENGESATLEMKEAGYRMTMRISAYDLRRRLLACALDGTSAAENLPCAE